MLRLTGLAFVLSFGIALVVSLGLEAGGLVDTPLLVAIILCATSLGVLVPVLKDAGEISSTFGQLIIAAASIADFGAIILLSIFFSGEGGTGSTLLLLGALFALAAVIFGVVRGAEHSMRLRADLVRLQDTTAQIRVRAALVLFVGFAALAETLGLEVILGAFIAGAIVSLVDRDEVMTHPDFRRKLEAVGFGFFIPAFFVTSGVRFDLGALTSSASSVIMVPIFLAALLAARGIPAILYRRVIDARHAAIAGMLQATSLPFIVAATSIGLELGLIDAAGSAALIGAGLLSVLIFPLAGLLLLKRGAPSPKRRAGARVTPGPAPGPTRDIPTQEEPMSHTIPATEPRTDVMPGLKGKNVLVTGGSSGIGQAIAVRFAQYGANVAINYLRRPEEAHDTEEQVHACVNRVRRGGRPGRAGRRRRLRRGRRRAHGAGGRRRPRRARHPGQQRRHPDLAAHRGALERRLRPRPGREPPRLVHVRSRGDPRVPGRRQAGSIVNISSVHQIIPKPGYLGYSASKGGMQNLTRTLALEYAARGIRVNGVGPGATVTPINRAWIDDPVKRAQVEEHIPMRRAGDADEMAGVTCFLASDLAAYITGQTIFVDGGLTLFPSFSTPWSSE